MGETYSFDEVMGSPPPSKPSQPTGAISLEDAGIGVAPEKKKTNQPNVMVRVAKAVQQFAKDDPWLQAIDKGTETVQRYTDVALDNPLKNIVSSGKAMFWGTEGMLASGWAGLKGLASWRAGLGFSKEFEKTQASHDKALKIFHAITRVNNEPSDKQEQAAYDLLGLLPEAGVAAGDEVHLRSLQGMTAAHVPEPIRDVASALLGAGTQGVAAFILLKPDKAAEAVKRIPKEPKSKEGQAFDDLVVNDPNAASEVVNHVNKADPNLAKELNRRLDEILEKKPEVVGKDAARADIEKRVGEEEAMREVPKEEPITKPHIKVKSGYVPVKRIGEVDVAPLTPEEGPLQDPLLTHEQAAAALRSTMKKGHETLQRKPKKPVPKTSSKTKLDRSTKVRSAEELLKGLDAKPLGSADIIDFPDKKKKTRNDLESITKAMEKGSFTKDELNTAVRSLRGFIEKNDPRYGTGISKENWDNPFEVNIYEGFPGKDGEKTYNVYVRNVNKSIPYGKFDNLKDAENLRDILQEQGKAFPVRSADGGPPRTKGALHQEWTDLHSGMRDIWHSMVGARDAGMALSTHMVLDEMISNAAEKGALKGMLEHLRRNVDDADIMPVKKIELYGQHYNSAGVYDPITKSIYMKTNVGEITPFSSQTLVHEMIHAATHDFIFKFPNHPLVRELKALHENASERLAELEKEADKYDVELFGGMNGHGGNPWGSYYGLTNPMELVAEAKSNPTFQKLLIASERFKKSFDKLKAVASKMVDKISAMLGIKDPKETALLRNILDTTDKIMAKQKRMRPEDRQFEDPTLYHNEGEPVKESEVEDAFDWQKKVPGLEMTKGKLEEYFQQVARLVNPEALGGKAKSAAAVIARHIAEQMQKDSFNIHRSKARRDFWNHRPKESAEFIRRFEKGEEFSDPTLNKAAAVYREWNNRIFTEDKGKGLEYEPVDNYLYHTFDDGEAVAKFFERKYGVKWGDPGFIKDRSFQLYDQAIKAGFKPKYTNPEDIMLARQHASDVATSRVDILDDLERFGLAKRLTKEFAGRPDFPATRVRSPNGNWYWVHDQAEAVLHNAFDTKSLWTMKGIGGDAFRGAMWLKNAIVPFKLGFSLFHPLHVATIDNATAMVRTTKGLLTGTVSAPRWLGDMTNAVRYKGFIDNPRMGGRVMKVYKGLVPDSKLTSADITALQYMAEGGMIPEMAAQYKNKAIEGFKKAVRERSLTTPFRAPFALMELIQKPMFEIWIPNLKIASYLRDVQSAIKADPTLLENPLKRMEAFRKLSKSVDNRYGEMAYNTLFMNKMVKDLAVANTLSLGWQMGFLREYGGGGMDLGQAIGSKGGIAKKASKGLLDRPLFVMFYTTQALAYGGLLTWALTGQTPQSLIDYVYPRTGEKNEKGEDQRANTMFYPREFGSIYKHVEDQGIVGGLGHLAASKSSGLIGMVSEWASGVNSFGQEIRDPDAPLYKQTAQTLANTLSDLQPISVQAFKKGGGSFKEAALDVAGFTPAPKYVTQSRAEGFITSTFQKYYAGKETSFEKAMYSKDVKELRKMWDKEDDGFDDKLDEVTEQYGLTAKEAMNLRKTISKGSGAEETMFKRLNWHQQKKALDLMTSEEREKFLPLSNKAHLRYDYEEVAQ